MKRIVKCLIVFGTRPEAIKMAPLLNEMIKYKQDFDVRVCVTAQHRQMLDQVIDFFDIVVDYDLDLMRPGQDLYTLTSEIITNLKKPLEDFHPDYVFVHGDTTTSMATALAAFYNGISVCHVEAGLRTNNKYSPFPEELNRQLTGRIADFHFAPTEDSRLNLLRENVSEDTICVTGNTVIDALMESTNRINNVEYPEIESLKTLLEDKKKIILVTGHRRENYGKGFASICEALRKIALRHKEVTIVFPVHLNPNVKDVVFRLLSGVDNIKLIAPQAYPAFVWLMNRSYLILTDSGGIQEEAPSLGKPVLVLRDTTERTEAVSAGTVVLVGTDTDTIVRECEILLTDEDQYSRMSSLHNPYGDGKASERIIDFIKERHR
ncbi:non-hydrolyzing UDP-N-acetylglucosamine 2-epimerase [Sphingobacterium spiritivorum]|uniref:non-hydrolyzing UDP-N-acetylglucosamine 2-epimerase n=1 Tax=Sphingobacterium spiritivorum TaxID=258 RepID=UPI003DA623DB